MTATGSIGREGVDVLAVMVALCSHGGTFEPRRVIPEWNRPRSTGTIASHLRPSSTASVRRALEKAAIAGDVECVGTGVEHCKARNKSAAMEKELYWRITDATLARIELIEAARDVERRAGPDREPRLRAALAAITEPQS